MPAAERREAQATASAARDALKALPDYQVLMSLADWKYSGTAKAHNHVLGQQELHVHGIAIRYDSPA